MTDRASQQQQPPTVCRRGALQIGLSGLSGLSLPALLRQRANAGETMAKDTAVIFLFLHGGPSQLETYDLKPLATSEVRGPFRPISTKVPDLQLCELLPLHAKIANRFTLIRSCTHGDGGHFEAHGRFMSGNAALKPGTFESAHPQMGAIIKRDRQGEVVLVYVESKNATDADLIHLVGLTRLKTLKLTPALGTNQITDAGLANITELVNLESLELSRTRVTDAGLVHLQKLAKLKNLALRGTQITDGGLAHLERFTQLQQLDLRNCRKLTHDGVLQLRSLNTLKKLNLPTQISLAGATDLKNALPTCRIFRQPKGLREQEREKTVLDLEKMPGIQITKNDQGELVEIRNFSGKLYDIWKLTSLKKLHVKSYRITDKDLASLRELTRLQTLELHNTNITGTGLAHLKKLTNLRTLHLDSKRITNTGLVHLRELVGLQDLQLGFCKQVTDATLKALGRRTDLRKLSLGSPRITDQGLQYLGQLNNLTSLTLNGTSITNAGLAHLVQLPNLRTLELRHCKKIDDEGLSHLQDMAHLQNLDLIGCKISDNGLAHLKDLTSLTSIRLPTTIGNAGLEYLANLTGLQKLGLAYTKVTDAGLSHIQGLTDLRELDLTRYITPSILPRPTKTIPFTDAGLRHLKEMVHLQKLNLNCANITDESLTHLMHMTDLRELSLFLCTRITDDGLVHLKELTRLEKLNLHGTFRVTNSGVAHLRDLKNLTDLTIGAYVFPTRVTDAGLVHLKGLTNLRHLSLSGCGRITGPGLSHLTGLTELKQLDLDKTRVAQANIDELKQALPKLRVARP